MKVTSVIWARIEGHLYSPSFLMVFFHYIFRGLWEEHHWASDHTTEHRGLDDQPSERNFVSHCVWFLLKGGLSPVQQSAGACPWPQE